MLGLASGALTLEEARQAIDVDPRTRKAVSFLERIFSQTPQHDAPPQPAFT